MHILNVWPVPVIRFRICNRIKSDATRWNKVLSTLCWQVASFSLVRSGWLLESVLFQTGVEPVDVVALFTKSPFQMLFMFMVMSCSNSLVLRVNASFLFLLRSSNNHKNWARKSVFQFHAYAGAEKCLLKNWLRRFLLYFSAAHIGIVYIFVKLRHYQFASSLKYYSVLMHGVELHIMHRIKDNARLTLLWEPLHIPLVLGVA